MRWLIRLVSELVEDVGCWLPVLGLLLIASGLLMSLLGAVGRR
jgi:hypothetical protein